MNTTESNLCLRVRVMTYQAQGMTAYEAVDPNGGLLPPFTAGAHIDIHLPGQMIRQYSLCNNPAERHRYVFCVQREDNGRGGSKAVHETVRIGENVTISLPRNNFPLAPDARRHMFLAGGIGITPMMAMLHAARATGTAWQLYYCTRNQDRTAFLDELATDIEAGLVVMHHDGGKPENALDFKTLLSAYTPGTHLYYCGPASFMRAVSDASTHWPQDAVHCEYFSVPAEPVEPVDSDKPADGDAPTTTRAGDSFQIKVNSTAAVYDVPAGKSIVQVLAENGIVVATSCESGLCGTCRTGYLHGQPDHRDFILSEADKANSVLICCARSQTSLLVLDL